MDYARLDADTIKIVLQIVAASMASAKIHVLVPITSLVARMPFAKYQTTYHRVCVLMAGKAIQLLNVFVTAVSPMAIASQPKSAALIKYAEIHVWKYRFAVSTLNAASLIGTFSVLVRQDFVEIHKLNVNQVGNRELCSYEVKDNFVSSKINEKQN